MSEPSSRQMRDDYRVRPRGDADLDGLIALWLSAWRKAMPQIAFETRRDWFATHLIGLEAAGYKTICIFTLAGGPLGFISVNPQAHHVDQLAVAPEAWGSGIARELIAEARHLSPQALCLDVNCDNPRAVRFYEREGFERMGEGINAVSGLRTWQMKWVPKT